MKLRVKEAIEATGGVLVKGRDKDWLGAISTDSRTIGPGQTFIPLKGEKYDGHNFIHQAIKRGARAIIISRHHYPGRIPDNIILIQVNDTLKALGDLAAMWRRKFPLKVVAVTGSNGKTTTKEMTARAISGKFQTLRNEGNLNNLVGLPLSIFRLNKRYDAAVLEMGTNHPGEIKRLTQIARPDVGIITNTGPVHLEGLKSIPGVIAAKSEMIYGLPENSTFILNLDQEGLCNRAKGFPGKIIGFSTRAHGGLKNGLSIHILKIWPEVSQGRPRIKLHIQQKMNSKPEGRPVSLSLPGLSPQNAANALAAIAAARALAVPLKKAAERINGFNILAGRGRVYRTRQRAILIDDTYNANPASMRTALENLLTWKKDSIAVAALGEMMELGERAQKEHRKLGKMAAEMGIDYLFVKPCSKHNSVNARNLIQGAIQAGMSPFNIAGCHSHRQMTERIKQVLKPGTWILVKGSRKMKMEQVVNELIKGGKRLA